MANLLETYSRQLKVAEAYVSKNYDGKQISSNTALTTAVLLDNTNRYITEQMNTMATERSNMGAWKKFCLNLTNIAVPSLIANDLVIVHPMTSYSGAVAYLEYQSRTTKGGIQGGGRGMAEGTKFNGVFAMGDVDESRINFTSQVIVETAGSDGSVALTPMAAKKFFNKEDKKFYDAKITREGADAPIYADVVDGKIDGLQAGDKVAYFSEEFQMEHVPAQDIPTIGPVMKSIPLVAQPRRIAVRYDQITAFQAKTDYGFSLDKQIAEQACGELAYEIDCEIVDMLYQAAQDSAKAYGDKLTWSAVPRLGVSTFEHFNAFLRVITKGIMAIYKRTKKYGANYMVCAPDVITVLSFCNGYTAVKNPKLNGPYKAGELNGLSVYVTPQLADGQFFLGLNGSDMMSSAGVYAPYMAIVPTQLLGTPDGGLSQGFSTWYAKAILNSNLVIAGEITDLDKVDEVEATYVADGQAANGNY